MVLFYIHFQIFPIISAAILIMSMVQGSSLVSRMMIKTGTQAIGGRYEILHSFLLFEIY